VYDLADNFEQTPLITTRSDLTSEKPRLTPGTDIGGGETAGGDTEHGQIGLVITDGDRLRILCQGPASKRSKAGPFIDLLGYDGCVDHRVTESEPIEPQIHEQLMHNVG
jgi:hypothetical protein